MSDQTSDVQFFLGILPKDKKPTLQASSTYSHLGTSVPRRSLQQKYARSKTQEPYTIYNMQVEFVNSPSFLNHVYDVFTLYRFLFLAQDISK